MAFYNKLLPFSTKQFFIFLLILVVSLATVWFIWYKMEWEKRNLECMQQLGEAYRYSPADDRCVHLIQLYPPTPL